MKTRPANNHSISRFGTLVAFLLSFLTAIVAPISAIRWSRAPFPGFLVEQTLVISTTTGSGWNGTLLGINYPMRVTLINDQNVKNGSEYRNILNNSTVGQRISITTVLPDGTTQLYSSLELSQFPFRDLLRLFWLPYGIGLIYLGLGVWVFRLRGSTVAGRAFAYFSASAAIVNMLTFSVWTSHFLTPLWNVAVAQIGGAIIGLTIVFPIEAASSVLRSWVRALAYGFSFLLAAWGLFLIYNIDYPWAYVTPWLVCYLYAAFGIAVLIISLIFRLRTPLTLLAHQQVRIVLWGALLAFAPIGIWFAMQAFVNTSFNPIFLSSALVLFPSSIAFAMARYHLWEFDIVIRRTIIYTTLTLFLIAIYLFLVVAVDSFFDHFVRSTNFFNVLATFVIVLIFTPLRRVVQRYVDHHWYKGYFQNERRIQEFAHQLRTEVDLGHLSDELVVVIEQTMQPDSISFWVPKNRRRTGGKDV